MNALPDRSLSDRIMADALAHPADPAGWRHMGCAPRLPDDPLSGTRFSRPVVLVLFESDETLECGWYGPCETDNPGWWSQNSRPVAGRPLAWRPVETHPLPFESTLLRTEAYEADLIAKRRDVTAASNRAYAAVPYDAKRTPWLTEETHLAHRGKNLADAVSDEAEAVAQRARRDDLLRRAEAAG